MHRNRPYPNKVDTNFLAAHLSLYVWERRLSSRLARDLDIHKNLLHFHLCTFFLLRQVIKYLLNIPPKAIQDSYLCQQSPPPETNALSVISQHIIFDCILPKGNTLTHFTRERQWQRGGYKQLKECLPMKRHWDIVWADTRDQGTLSCSKM